MRQDQRRGGERLEKIVELHREHGLGSRQRHEVQACLEHDAERALGSDEELRQVERLARQERIEVVAADATQDLRKPAFDLVGVLGRQVSHRLTASRQQSVRLTTRRPARRSVHRRGVERSCRPTAAPPARARGRSSCRRSTDRAPLELLAIMPPTVARLAVEMSGAKRNPCGCSAAFSSSSTMPGSTRAQRSLGSHLEQAIEVLGRVDDQAAADRLAGLRRAAAAHRERAAKSRAELDDRDEVVLRPRNDDPDRLELIDAGVGGVERARDRVEADFAGHARFEGAPERVGIDQCGARWPSVGRGGRLHPFRREHAKRRRHAALADAARRRRADPSRRRPAFPRASGR